MTISSNEYFARGIFKDKNGICEVKTFSQSLTVGANRTVITAVTGKVLLVLSMTLSSAAAGVSLVSFKDGSGGTFLLQTSIPSNALAPVQWPPSELGYMKTTAGVGLFADLATNNAYLNGTYIEYTP